MRPGESPETRYIRCLTGSIAFRYSGGPQAGLLQSAGAKTPILVNEPAAPPEARLSIAAHERLCPVCCSRIKVAGSRKQKKPIMWVTAVTTTAPATAGSTFMPFRSTHTNVVRYARLVAWGLS